MSIREGIYYNMSKREFSEVSKEVSCWFGRGVTYFLLDIKKGLEYGDCRQN